jgi:hypothetical protein
MRTFRFWLPRSQTRTLLARAAFSLPLPASTFPTSVSISSISSENQSYAKPIPFLAFLLLPSCFLANGLLFQQNDNYVSNVANTVGRSILIGIISSAITLPANFFVGYLYRLCQYPFGTSSYKSKFFMTPRELHAASLKAESLQKKRLSKDMGEGFVKEDFGVNGILTRDPGLYSTKGPLDRIVSWVSLPYWWLWICHIAAVGIMFVCSWFVVSYKADFVSKGLQSVSFSFHSLFFLCGLRSPSSLLI